MALVFRGIAQGKTIAIFVLGSVAAFSDLLTETLQNDQRAGWVTFDFDPLRLDLLQLGRHIPVAGTLN